MHVSLFCCAATILIASVSFATPPETAPSGRPAVAAGGFVGTVLLKELPHAPIHTATKHIIPHLMPFSPEQYQALKAAAYGEMQNLLLHETTPPSLPIGDSPMASKVIFPPSANDEFGCGGFIPSDAALAASTSYLVEVDNSCIKILNPTTGAVISGPTSLQTFFGAGANVGDPRALFDAASSRFIVAAGDFDNNDILIAVSQSSNPTLGWNRYKFSMGVTCTGTGDFPMLGQTNQEAGDPKGAIYVSWNIFCPNNTISNFVGAISKTLAYKGSTISLIHGFTDLNVGGVNVDTVQPVNVFKPSDRPRGEFLVNTFNYNFGGGSCATGCNGVVLWDFYNGIPKAGQSQQLTSVVKPTTNDYTLSPSAPEPGCAINTCGPDTGTAKIGAQVNYVSGSLFAAVNDQTGILILELQPLVGDTGVIIGALLRNEICFACTGFSDGGQAYYGGIQPDSERNWTLVYNFSAPGTANCTPSATCLYPSTAYLSHRVTQVQNTVLDAGFIIVQAQAFYKQLDSQNRNRWGDYTGVAPTLLKSNSYWFDGQWVDSNGNWAKVIGQNGYTSPTQP